MSSSTTARKLAERSSTGKLALPMGTWTTPLLRAVVRYSTLPPLKSLTALATSVVTVPVFGLGIRPRGPNTRPRRPTRGIRSGVAMATSKSMLPFSISAATSSAPTPSAPACLAGGGGGLAGGEHADAHILARPRRQRHGAPQHLVGLAGIDAQRDGQLDG